MTQNGSFLFLNLGTNKVGLGNSFMFSNPNSSPNPNPNPNPNPYPYSNSNPNSNLNPNSNPYLCNLNSNMNPPVSTRTISNTTSDQELLQTPQNPSTKSKKNSKLDSEDPEWIPERELRHTRTGTGTGTNVTNLKPNQNPNKFATKTIQEQPQQRQQTSNRAPASLPPPQYLINLLGFFGWKVSLKSANRDYVYQSPNGMLYHSLPKAFETFLDGNSKYKEKPWLASSSINGRISSNKTGTSETVPEIISTEKRPKSNNGVRKRNFEKVEGLGENGEAKKTLPKRTPAKRPTRRKDQNDGSDKEKEKEKEKRKFKSKMDELPKVDNATGKKLETSSSKQPDISGSKRSRNGKKDQIQRIPSSQQRELRNERRAKTVIHENRDHHKKASCNGSGKPIHENGALQFKERHNVKRCILTARPRSTNENENKSKKPVESQRKFTILSNLIESGILTENERVMYVSTDSRTGTGSNFLIGTVSGDGIICTCCDDIVSVPEFESHAGANTRNPWENTFLISGKPLVDCLKEMWEKEKLKFGENSGGDLAKGKSIGMYDENDESDDTCGICADGGRLLCCDGCLSTFHQDCLNLKELPEGSWYCPYCRCQFCKAHGAEETFGSGPANSLDPLTCKQCKRNYHKKCAWRNDYSESILFCSKTCNKLEQQLSEMIGISNRMENNFSWTLLKITEDLGDNSKKSISSILEANLKLAMCRSVLNECFLPLTDPRTGIEVLSQAIFSQGSCYNRLNYEGFYTVVLQKGEEVISVALLRFHGPKLAEMPFVGTRPQYQKQGMCHRILKGVEQLLISVEIEKLVVPAVPEMVNTWTKSFSFKPLKCSLQEEVKNMSLVIFAETTLLEKTMFKRPPNKRDNVEALGSSAFPRAQTNLYASGFPFFSTQEIFQHAMPSQLQDDNNINLEDYRSFFAQGPVSSDELSSFNNDVYNNISFESLLRM